jgi:hypothetical protein
LRSVGTDIQTINVVKGIYEDRKSIKQLDCVLVVEASNGTKTQMVKKASSVDLYVSKNGVFENKAELSFEEAQTLLNDMGITNKFLATEIKAVHENAEVKNKRITDIKESLDIVNVELGKINELGEGEMTDELGSIKNELTDKKNELEIQLSKEENAETDDLLEKISDKVLFFVNKIKDTIDAGESDLEPEYTTDGYVMENGISVKILIKGTNIKTYSDINSSVFLLLDSQNKELEELITPEMKQDIAEIMAHSNVENFEDWKRSLRTVLSNLAAIGKEEETEEEEPAVEESLMDKLTENRS